MHNRILLLLFVVLFFLDPRPGRAAGQCLYEKTECDFYCAKAESLNCSKTNYLLSFGQKYCRIYLYNYSFFSTEARPILARIRSCLIAAVESSDNLTCSNVRAQALNSHVSCYLENGFCQLSNADKLLVYWLGRGLIFETDMFEAMQAVWAECGRRFEN